MLPVPQENVTETFCPGLVHPLHVSGGHKGIINFRDEPEKAAETVRDMLRAGFILIVTDREGNARRVLDYDHAFNEYIIVAGPTDLVAPIAKPDASGSVAESSESVTTSETAAETSSEEKTTDSAETPKKGRGGRKRVPATDVETTAIGRTAGG